MFFFVIERKKKEREDMEEDINVYPVSLENALIVYATDRRDLFVNCSKSVEEMIGEYSQFIYSSMVLANEFYNFYSKLMIEGEE